MIRNDKKLKMKKVFTIKNILITIVVLLVDFATYIYFGLMILSYEDFYDESKGPYWSLGSMTGIQQFAYIGQHILIGLNWLLLGWIGYRIVKYFMKSRNKQFYK